MRSRSAALLAIVCIIFCGCKKNADDTSTTTTKVYLVSSIAAVTTAGTETVTYKYDDQNHLTEQSNALNPVTFKYKYDGSDRVIQYQSIYASGYSSQANYSYGASGVINYSGTSSVNGGATESVSGILNINSNNLLTKSAIGISGSYTDYTYDDKGNLLTQNDYTSLNTTVGIKTTYTYDDQKCVFANIKGTTLNLIKKTANNIKTQIIADYLHGTTTTFNSTFEYNSDGYPVKQTTVQTSSLNANAYTTVYTISYIVK